MAGRKPKMNWYESRGQWCVTVGGKLHPLGTDETTARQQFDFLTGRAEMGHPAVNANPAYTEIADRWLEHVHGTFAADRFRICTARLEEFCNVIGKGRRVKELRPEHIKRWLEPKKLAPGTRRLYSAMILASLNWAASRKVGLIARNPLRGLVELPEGASRGGDAVWPAATYKKVLEVANPAFADMVRILAWTGARPSTVCKVEARHYLSHLRLWDVEDMYKGRVSKRKYVRRIWLSPPAVVLVERLNRIYPDGPIFRNSKGKPWTPDTLGVYLYQMQNKFTPTKNLDWPAGLRMYGLRHTFATAFIRQHPDKLEYLRELLGHRDLKMIRRHYGHLFDEHAAIHNTLDDFKVF